MFTLNTIFKDRLFVFIDEKILLNFSHFIYTVKIHIQIICPFCSGINKPDLHALFMSLFLPVLPTGRHGKIRTKGIFSFLFNWRIAKSIYQNVSLFAK